MSMLAPLTATVAVLGLLTGPAPADPHASGSLSTTDAVLHRGCQHHSYRYRVNVPTNSWYLSVTVKGPDGKVVTTDHPYEGKSGTSHIQLCDFDKPGRYTMSAKGEWYDDPDDGKVHHFPVRSTSFVVRRAH